MTGERRLTPAQAIAEALVQELRRDPAVVLVGAAGPEAAAALREFGAGRVLDAPAGPAGLAAVAAGAALAGLRPVVDAWRAGAAAADVLAALEHAAAARGRSASQLRAPLVVRLGGARPGWLDRALAGLPGLKVVCPATPHDAKCLLAGAIRDDAPVVVVEDGLEGAGPGPVPAGDCAEPLGAATVRRAGDDVTIVAVGPMVAVALAAADLLAADGASAEVVDVRTLAPLDVDALVRSAARTGRVVVAGHGMASELAAAIADGAFFHLDAPVVRWAAPDGPAPYAPALAALAAPSAERLADGVRALLRVPA